MVGTGFREQWSFAGLFIGVFETTAGVCTLIPATALASTCISRYTSVLQLIHSEHPLPVDVVLVIDIRPTLLILIRNRYYEFSESNGRASHPFLSSISLLLWKICVQGWQKIRLPTVKLCIMIMWGKGKRGMMRDSGWLGG